MKSYRVFMRASGSLEPIISAESPEDAAKIATDSMCSSPSIRWSPEAVEVDGTQDADESWPVAGRCEGCNRLLLDGLSPYVQDVEGYYICASCCPDCPDEDVEDGA